MTPDQAYFQPLPLAARQPRSRRRAKPATRPLARARSVEIKVKRVSAECEQGPVYEESTRVDGAVSHLQKVDVPSNRVLGIVGNGCDSVLALDGRDIVGLRPDGDFDGDGHGVVGEHEALQLFMPQLVIADRGDDEDVGIGCCAAGICARVCGDRSVAGSSQTCRTMRY
jgi:hypothetical protein